MNKAQAKEVKQFANELTNRTYKMTYSEKSGILHIRIGTYYDELKDDMWIAKKNSERRNLIKQIKERFSDFNVAENNKRYQGFINDICITVH